MAAEGRHKLCMIDFDLRALTCGDVSRVGYCMIDFEVFLFLRL
jgi:hypothetical protein